MAKELKEAAERHLRELETIEMDKLLKLRYDKFRRMGTFVDDGLPRGEGH